MKPNSFSLPNFAVVIVIIFLGILAYGNSLNAPFQFDDASVIEQNPAIENIYNVKAIWAFHTIPSRFIPLYTFALNYAVGGLDVTGYHVVNILIHIFNALLVWQIVRLLLRTPVLSVDSLSKHSSVLALASALIFLTHPLQTQAVTYITQRYASLATLFYLATICLYLRGRLSVQKRLFFFFGAGLMAVLGVFSKEIVFTLPLMIILIEFCFFDKAKTLVRSGGVWVLACFLVAIPLMVWISTKGGTRLFSPMPSQSHAGDVITSFHYLLTQFRVIFVYLQKFIIPLGQNLDYDFELSRSLLETKTLLSFAFLWGMLYWAIRVFQRMPLVSFGIFWFFLALSVESSVFPIRNVIFEHRMYLPMAGLAMSVSAGLFYAFKMDARKFLFVVALLTVIYGGLTIARNQVWGSRIALWEDVIQKSPNKSRGYIHLANAYANKSEHKKAYQLLNQVIEIDPQSDEAYNNRAIIYYQNSVLSLALEDFSKAIELNPQNVKAYMNRGNLYGMKKQYDLALADFDRAIVLKPDYAPAYLNLGNVYASQGLHEKAIEQYNKALSLREDFAAAYFNRAHKYALLGRAELAERDYQKAKDLGYGPAIQYLEKLKTRQE